MEDNMGSNGTNDSPNDPVVMPPAEPTPPPPADPTPPQAPEPVPPAPPAEPYSPPPPPPSPGTYQPGSGIAPGEKNKVVAGVLGILLGSLGVHKFYLGYMTEGIILLAVTVVSFGTLSWVSGIVGLIEGIMYLTKTDEEFYQTYVANKKKWF